MDAGKLNDWMQVLGIFALVASLIFVGLQLRQSQEIALSQTHTARAGKIIDQILSGSENPYFLSARAKIDAGNSDEVTPMEQQALFAMANAAIYSIEDAYYQHRNGFISDERWNASRDTIKWFMSGQAHIQARETYERNPSVWSSEFQQVVNDIIREIDAQSATN